MTPEIENEQLRTRMGEMAAEVERLQSVIDEANAQDAVGIVDTVGGYPDDSEHKVRWLVEYKSINNGDKLYARPTPAQQVPDAIKLLQRVSASASDKVLFNGSHGHAGYVIEEQQSPAVTVPDFETWWRNLPSYRDADKPAAKMAWDYLAGQISGFQSPRITEQDDNLAVLVSQELYSNGGAHESQIDVARRIIGFIASRLPNRVTEQDARNMAEWIIENHTDYDTSGSRSHHGRAFCLDCGVYEDNGQIKHTENCIVTKCSALLDKLNGDKNAR